jgi:aminoglycoside phosphotransferase (APT) family kinase protein
MEPPLPPQALEDWHAFSRLAQVVFPGSRLLRAWPLSGGISARMTVLECALLGGETGRVVVRQPGEETLRRDPGIAKREYRLLQIARAHDIPAPAPLHLVQISEFLPSTCLVMEYIDGEPVFAPAHLGPYLRQAAEALAEIHSVNSERLAVNGERWTVNGGREGVNGERWNVNGEEWWIDAGAAAGEREGLRRPRGRVNEDFIEGRVRDALEAAWPFPSRNLPALLHGDFWPGNWLWSVYGERLTVNSEQEPVNGEKIIVNGEQLAVNGEEEERRQLRLVAVVDWEDGCAGDPLIDLAISRLDVLCIFGEEALGAFTGHYLARSRVDAACLPFWDLVAVLRMIRLAGEDLEGWAAFYPPRGRPDITAGVLRERILWFAEQALGKVKG